MKGYYDQKEYKKAITYAEKVLNNAKGGHIFCEDAKNIFF
jgi:hypothetical protein